MKTGRQRKLVVVLTILVIIIGGCGYGKRDKGGDTQKPSANPGAVVPASDSGQDSSGVIKVTAPALVSEFETDKAAADKEYKGKTLEVSGVVNSVRDLTLTDQICIALNSSEPSSYVFCYLSHKHDVPAHALKKGQNVVIRGRYGGPLSGNVCLTDCEITQK